LNDGTVDAPKENDGGAAVVDVPNIDGNVDSAAVEAAAPNIDVDAGVEPKSEDCCGWVVVAEPNIDGGAVVAAAVDEAAPNEKTEGKEGMVDADEAAAVVEAGSEPATEAVAVAALTALKKDKPPGCGAGAAEDAPKLNVGGGRLVGIAVETGFVVSAVAGFGWNEKLNAGAADAGGANEVDVAVATGLLVG
jgi:hypothetical protein